MKNVEVVETRTYNVSLTSAEARAIILLDSYVLRGPLKELAEALQSHEGEPDGGELLFDIYDESYDELLGSERCVVIDFDGDWDANA